VRLAEFWEYFHQDLAAAGGVHACSVRHAGAEVHRPLLGSSPLNAITKRAVRSFLADLTDAGVGAATVNSTYRLLRRLLAVAVEEGRIAANPAPRIAPPKPEVREMKFLTAKEVLSLSDAVDDRYRVLVLFLAYTGTRIGEAAALRIGNLDFLKGQARIVEASKEVDVRQFTVRRRTGRTGLEMLGHSSIVVTLGTYGHLILARGGCGSARGRLSSGEGDDARSEQRRLMQSKTLAQTG
jgi:integrase